ncbi:recombinase family protein [Deinococcus roseus]|uniref:Resolvase n=1 Tax=Deinococcus roseus TaxID=392414 RepID=A0ABQ2DHK1_9DEIO|nr:recombinase family protein [Deinococcus roseus]GGJ55861.1 resolvase [Deinococcus roseus]
MSFVSSENSGPKVGYARVSTRDQNLNLQEDALTRAGCLRIFKDTSSGAKKDRPGLSEALNYLRAGDTLVVWKLDRLGRSLQHLIEVVTVLNEKKVNLLVLQEGINTSTANGKLFFHIFGALAEFERDLIRERTQAGLDAARARGRQGGRKSALSEDRQQVVLELLRNPAHSVKEIAETFGVSERCIYRLKAKHRKKSKE